MTSTTETSGGPTGDRRGPPARFRKLKPRPGQSGNGVAEHQRARIHAATIELAYEDGYSGLTVTGIARAAGVSNRTFYENFSDKDDCFLATYELIVRHTVREILAARQSGGDWRAKLRAGFLVFAHEVAENPKAAHLALVEAFSLRPAFERMRHTFGLFEALVADSLTGSSGGVELAPDVTKAIVAGGRRVAVARLLEGKTEKLLEDADGLMQWALSLCSEKAKEVSPGSPPCAPVLLAPPLTNSNHRKVRPGDPRLGDERVMILTAVAELAAAEGYAELTVPRIRAAAGISRRRFDEHFEGVTDSFLAALEMLIEPVRAEAGNTYLSVGAWPNGVLRTVETVCREIAMDPLLVRLAFFELYVPGRETVSWRSDLIADLSSALRASAPVEQRPSELAAEASIAAAWAALHEYAVAGRSADLPRAAGTISYLLLAPAIGAEAAAKVIRAMPETSGREDLRARGCAKQLTSEGAWTT